jgi:hypothetical protein
MECSVVELKCKLILMPPHNWAASMRAKKNEKAKKRPSNAQYFSVGTPPRQVGFNMVNNKSVSFANASRKSALPALLATRPNMSLNALLRRIPEASKLSSFNKTIYLKSLERAINTANGAQLRRVLNTNSSIPQGLAHRMERRWLESFVHNANKNTLLKTLHIYALMPNHRNSIEEILVKKLLTNANAAAIANALNSYNFKNANRAALNNAFENRSIKGYSISG